MPRQAVHPSERIDGHMACVLGSVSESARLRAGVRLWTAARAVVRAAILADHDDWSSDRVDRELAFRMSRGLVDRGTG